jgi:hypothetical protein
VRGLEERVGSKKEIMRIVNAMLAMGAFTGCLQERETVHLSIGLQNCYDLDFNSICVEEGIAEDSPSYPFIYSSFEMTLSGNIVLNGKDTTVSRYKLSIPLAPGGHDSLIIPAGIGKSGPPLVVKACLKDEGGGVACDSLIHSEL